MNEKTQKLTFGALLVAVFGVLLLLNRQTGGMLEETFIFLFPIPMVAFSAKYGWKDSLPVFVCTVLISIFCGIFTSAFYAITQSFIGMVYGCCLHAKRDTTRTMILVMALSVISNILSTFVLASLFGINMQEDIQLMQTSMQEAIEKDVITNIRCYRLATGFTYSVDSGIQSVCFGQQKNRQQPFCREKQKSRKQLITSHFRGS